MLHNTTRLEEARHQAEVGASVDQWTVREEFLRRRPEAVRVPLLEIPHAMGALSRVGVVHVARAADQELHLVLVVRNDVLGDVQDQVHALLLRDSPNEGEKGNTVVQVAVVEVLHLEQPFGANVVR